MRRLVPLLLLHLLVVALTGYSQRSATLVYVVASKTIFIWGERVQVQATVRDRQGVVQNVPVTWSVGNSAGYQGSDIPRATIDAAGNLQALVAGQLKVRANIHYDYNPYTLLDVDGAASVQVNPPETYRFTRAFVGEATRDSSVL